jgi:preprotein translocase subunit SecB
VLLDPIDFGGAYMQQLQAMQQPEGEGNGSGENTPSETPSEA